MLPMNSINVIPHSWIQARNSLGQIALVPKTKQYYEFT